MYLTGTTTTDSSSDDAKTIPFSDLSSDERECFEYVQEYDNDVFAVELHKGEHGLGLGLIDGLVSSLILPLCVKQYNADEYSVLLNTSLCHMHRRTTISSFTRYIN